MQKSRIIAASCAGLLLIAGIGINLSVPAIEPSAEDYNIQNAQRILSSLETDTPVDPVVYNINTATGDMIDDNVALIQSNNIKSPTDGIVNIVNRDWTKYDDEYGCSNMTTAQRAFYHRLESVSVEYLTDNTLDAYYLDAYSLNVTKGIAYKDLGLDSKEAVAVTQWFLYNNPQYYFYQSRFLSTDRCIYVGIYDAMADGDDRASTTNQVFAIVDDWIERVNDDEVTTYQKVLSAHDMLCEEIDYVSGTYDQSLYSAAVQKKTVCTGYSKAMSIILNASDIPTTVSISNYHAWNRVKMDDGQYYGFDATWDDSLNCHDLFGVSLKTLSKYDSSDREHIAMYPWSEWDPEYATSDYKVTSYDLTGRYTTDITVSQPTNLAVTFDEQVARVTWDSVDGATGYDVSVLNTSASIDVPVIRIKGLSYNQLVNFSVRAYSDVDGKRYYSDWATYQFTVPAQSSSSGSVSTTTTTVTQPVPETTTTKQTTTTKAMTTTKATTTKATTTSKSTTTTQPPVVKPAQTIDKPILSYEVVDSSTIRVKWNPVANANSYKVVISTDSSFSKIVGSSTVSTTSVKISNLDRNVTYYVSVVASNKFVDSDKAIISTKIGNTNTALAAPSKCTAEKLSSTKLKLTWTKVSGADKYDIELYRDAKYTDKLTSAKVSSNSVNISNLSAGPIYVRIRAVSGSGSNIITSDWYSVKINR